MQKHPTMSADQIAKLADCGVATVYRIKRTLKPMTPHNLDRKEV
jgi:transposase